MGNKNWVVPCIVLMVFVASGSCKNQKSEKQKDSTTYYGDLITSLAGESISFPMGLAYRPCEVNATVQFFQGNPFELADFSVINARELSKARNTMEVLHRLHLLNSVSAGGYGPPVSGAGRWKQGNDPSENSLMHIIQLEADPADGGVGLRISAATLSVLEKMDGDAVKMIADLLDLLSVLIRISEGFADQELLTKLNKSDKSFTAIETADLLTIPFRERELYSNLHRKLFSSLDAEMIAFGSRIMIEEVNSIAIRYQELCRTGSIDLDRPLVMETAYGLVQLLTERQDTVRLPSLVSLDPGGDDYYPVSPAVSANESHPVGITVDLAGNDIYGNDDADNMVCSSACGLSYILDMQGDDTYRSGSEGLAFAIIGCSVLDDRSGDDSYTCNGKYGLGAAFFGQALLIDYKGNDEYRAGSYSSGFGGPGGVALLLDFEGDDKYLAPSSSFTQGASSGRWADATDGFSMGGGVGMLLDCRGNDEYSAARFSQGASYYYGLGILADMEGDDSYNSLTHSQGSAVHTSLALFSDLSGNDMYNKDTDSSRLAQSIGYGRDWSSAFFIDRAGNDQYCFGNKSFGVGDIQSLGFALDCRGDDSYTWYKNSVYNGSGSFGSAQMLGEAMVIQPGAMWPPERWCAGVAFDMQGTDSYAAFSEHPEPVRFFRDRKTIRKTIGTTCSIKKDK